MRSLFKNTGAILGLLSPGYGGHRSGLKPDAVAERVRFNCSILNMPCQVGKANSVEYTLLYFLQIKFFNNSDIIISFSTV